MITRDAVDFSKTQRLLLLIDLNPLLHLQNPNPYLTSLLKSTQILLANFPSLSSFKFFFSSSSNFPTNLSNSICFDRPSNTYRSLSTALKCFPTPISPSGSTSSRFFHRASIIASSLRQVLKDYAWDYQLEQEIIAEGELVGSDSSFVRSNLVILFSPFSRQLKCLSEFIGLDCNDESLVNVDVFCEIFRSIFDCVNAGFGGNDIHLSWVDVKFELDSTEEKFEIDELGIKLGFLEKGIKSFGWGFYSTDLIILGSALVPFGLIYPLISFSTNMFSCRDNSNNLIVSLNLEISGISGNPIECRCCDLSVVSLKILPGNRCDDDLQVSNDQRRIFWDRFDGGTKLSIKAVQRYNEPIKNDGGLLDIVLVHDFSDDSRKERKVTSQDNKFFVDRVVKMLRMETGVCSQSTSLPIWTIILSFLYRENCCGVVSLTDKNGDSCLGILKPFTVHSALLYILDKKLDPNNTFNLPSGIDPTSKDMLREDGTKKLKRGSRFYKDLTWNTFCKMAFEQSDVDLGGIYFARDCTNSKKLKFLKCWMSQMKKSKFPNVTIPDISKPDVNNLEETVERLAESQHENGPAVSSSASARADPLTEASRIQDETALDFCAGNSDVFFSDLPKKIKGGLESGVDLAALAERLVALAIYWLYDKHEKDTSGGIVADELMKLLLWEPRELGKHQKNNDPIPNGLESETTIRQYELQILFRMEILRSEISTSIEESTKLKFPKQICMLLEKIQCRLDVGFFGDWSLDNYVGRIIKNRYSHTLEDVVNKIYKRMDLLPFVDEDESVNPLLNSEDSNQSWRDRQEKEETGENDIPCNVGSADEFFQGIKEEEHACRLIEAQNRRERARRFASFTSWAPDLRRVWAPKLIKPVTDSSHSKISKKKRCRINSYDTVCETPITKIDPYQEKDHSLGRTNAGNSVSKVLFQD